MRRREKGGGVMRRMNGDGAGLLDFSLNHQAIIEIFHFYPLHKRSRFLHFLFFFLYAFADPYKNVLRYWYAYVCIHVCMCMPVCIITFTSWTISFTALRSVSTAYRPRALTTSDLVPLNVHTSGYKKIFKSVLLMHQGECYHKANLICYISMQWSIFMKIHFEGFSI